MRKEAGKAEKAMEKAAALGRDLGPSPPQDLPTNAQTQASRDAGIAEMKGTLGKSVLPSSNSVLKMVESHQRDTRGRWRSIGTG